MSKAVEILEQLNAKTKNSVTVDLHGMEFKFNRDDAAYDVLINEIEGNNKITPVKDYLLQIVDKVQRDDLLKLINLPGLALQLAGKINAVLVPQIEISVKN